MSAGGGTMALSVLLRVRDQFSGPIRNIQARLGRFQRQAQVIARRTGFDRLANSLTRAGRAGGELYRATAQLGRRLAFLGTAAAGLGLGVGHTFASSTENVRIWGERLGIASDELQRMIYTAGEFGVKSDALLDALKELSMRTDEFVMTGRGPAADAFARLGLTSDQLAEVSGDTAALFDLVMDKIREVENVAARQRLVDEIFGGQGGEQLAAMASASAEELARLAREADQLNVVVGEEGTAAAENYMRSWRRMKGSLQGVRNIIGASLAPVLGDLMGQLTELIQEHQPAIQAWANDFAANLPDRLERLREQVVTLTETLRPFVDRGMELAEQFGVVNTLALLFGAVIGAPILVPLIQTTAAIIGLAGNVSWVALRLTGLALGAIPMVVGGLKFLAVTAIPWVLGALKTLALAVVAHPIMALVAGIAIGAAWLIANWEKVGPWFEQMWARFTGYVSDTWDQLTAFLGWDPLEVLRAGWGAVTDYIGQVTGAVERLVSGDWSAVMDLFRLSPLGAIQSAFGEAVDWISTVDWAEHGKALIQTLIDGIRSMASKPAEALSNVLDSARELLPFSDAKRGPFSRLTASGQAIPETLATGMARGETGFLAAFRDLAAGGLSALGDQRERDTVTVPEPQLGSGRIEPAQSRGVTVHRIDFHPQVTVRVGNDADARDVGDEIEARLERFMERDLWHQIKGVGEGS